MNIRKLRSVVYTVALNKQSLFVAIFPKDGVNVEVVYGHVDMKQRWTKCVDGAKLLDVL